MIRRLLGTLVAIAAAYVAAALLGPVLPTIAVRTETDARPTLAQVLARYAIHDAGEEFHLLRTPRSVSWDSTTGSFEVYDLANSIPEAGDVYSASGGNVEALYETLLLSLKVDGDPHLRSLQEDYKTAKSREGARFISSREEARREQVTRAALKALVAYAYTLAPSSGPVPLALGKAVRDFFAIPLVQVPLPGGTTLPFRPISTSPALASLRQSIMVPTVDIIVPQGQSPMAGTPAFLSGSLQHLKLAEVTIQRSWLDQTLLLRTTGPWVVEDPHLFGRGGAFQRIPVRLLLAQVPEVTTGTAQISDASTGNAAVSFGPFSYPVKNAEAKDGKVKLTPADHQWVIIGVISRRLG